MSVLKNYPGARVKILDGRLVPPPVQPGTSSVLIIGTANDGPVNIPIRFLNSTVGGQLFGTQTNDPYSLMRGVSHAGLGGCQDIWGVRITGKVAETILLDSLTKTDASGTYIGDGNAGGDSTLTSATTSYQLGRDYWSSGAIEFQQVGSQTWDEYTGTASMGVTQFKINRRNGWVEFGSGPDPASGSMTIATGSYWPHSIVVETIFGGNKYNGYVTGTVAQNTVEVVAAQVGVNGSITFATNYASSVFDILSYYTVTNTVDEVITTINTNRANTYVKAKLARHLTLGNATQALVSTDSVTAYNMSNGTFLNAEAHYCMTAQGDPVFNTTGLKLFWFADDEQTTFSNVPISDEGYTTGTFIRNIYDHLEPLDTAATYGIIKTIPGVYDMLEANPAEVVVPYGMFVDETISGVAAGSATSMNFCSQLGRYLYSENLNGWLKWGFISYKPPAGAVETLSVQRTWMSAVVAHIQTLIMTVSDYDGASVDTGKYVKVYAGPEMRLPGGNMAITFATPEAFLAGFNTTLRHSVGMTGKILPVTGMRYVMMPSYINALNEYHVVVGDRDQSTGRITVSRDDTFAQDIAVGQTSDWTFGASMRTGISLASTILARLRRMRGFPMNQHNIEAAKSIVNEILTEELKHENGGIRAFSFTLLANARDQILGELSIDLNYVPAGELRNINMKIALSTGL